MVAGANTTVPLDAQINLMESYRPLSRVAMVYNANEPAAAATPIAHERLSAGTLRPITP